MDRTFLLIGALAGFTGVTLGAFGAHALRGRLSPEMLAVFETGVRYQIYHALAIIATGLIAARMGGWLIVSAGWLLTAGIVLFSGSLYLLVVHRRHPVRRDHADRRRRLPARLGLPRSGGCLGLITDHDPRLISFWAPLSPAPASVAGRDDIRSSRC